MSQHTITDAITYSEVRRNLAETMDRVCDSHAPVIITRQKSRPVVMMSLDDFSSITETAYLLQSPANAARLRTALLDSAMGKTEAHNVLD